MQHVLHEIQSHTSIQDKKSILVSRLQPYLKAGLSIRKAALEAQISRATFYRYMNENQEFREQIEHYCNFNAIMLNNALFKQLLQIIEKQNGSTNTPAQKLSRDDIKFLKWYVRHTKTCREEYGRPKTHNTFDPNFEIQKLHNLLKINSTIPKLKKH